MRNIKYCHFDARNFLCQKFNNRNKDFLRQLKNKFLYLCLKLLTLFVDFVGKLFHSHNICVGLHNLLGDLCLT